MSIVRGIMSTREANAPYTTVSSNLKGFLMERKMGMSGGITNRFITLGCYRTYISSLLAKNCDLVTTCNALGIA